MIAYGIGQAVLSLGSVAFGFWMLFLFSNMMKTKYYTKPTPKWAMPAAWAIFLGSGFVAFCIAQRIAP
jgi:hypothetical protein